MWAALCRVLFEVASLEREAALPHQACLHHLAASIRTCHKIHNFAGGFEQTQSELFDKASPSTQRPPMIGYIAWNF